MEVTVDWSPTQTALRKQSTDRLCYVTIGGCLFSHVKPHRATLEAASTVRAFVSRLGERDQSDVGTYGV